MELYKVLSEDGRAMHGGVGAWSLPAKLPDGSWQPGEWMPAVSPVELCARGYHGVEAGALVRWLGPTIYAMEGCGEHQEDDAGRHVFSEARLLRQLEAWTPAVQRLFACDCAEHVLSFWQAKYPRDDRPALAIAVARRYARGEATDVERTAARTAARAAARAAAAAAWDAPWAAWAAAAAAGAAAWDAARYAAWDAENSWQSERLWEYLRGEEEPCSAITTATTG